MRETQHEMILFLLLSCKMKEPELPRLVSTTHVASVQILLFKRRKLKYRYVVTADRAESNFRTENEGKEREHRAIKKTPNIS